MNVGLIGCGRVAQIHMGAYKNINNAHVIAVSDVDLKKAKAFAESYQIDNVFSSYEELFKIKDLDLVDICTPTSTHASIVCDAAKSGHNILVEKPMAYNSEECERMINESQKNGVKLCVVHNQLFFPSVKELKSTVDSGNFNLTYFRTSHMESFEFLKAHGLAHGWNVSPEQGGILWEVGYHLAYLQLSFLREIREVYALGVKAKYPVYDEFIVLLRTSGERYGIMEISWVADESEIVYEIGSSDGKRIQTFLPHGYIIEKWQRPPAGLGDILRSFYVDGNRFFKKWVKFGMSHVTKKQPPGHFDLINNYMESLRNDSPPPVTPEDGKNTIRLLECIEKSLDEHRPVMVSM
jgi:predicted dehydrogenase